MKGRRSIRGVRQINKKFKTFNINIIEPPVKNGGLTPTFNGGAEKENYWSGKWAN